MLSSSNPHKYRHSKRPPKKVDGLFDGRSVGIRTPGLLDPNQARYQTSPHPGKALPLYSSPQGMSSTGAGKIPRHISPSGPIEMGQNDTERGHPHGCQRDKEAPPERHPSDPRGETASAATGGLPGSLRRGVSGPGHRLWSPGPALLHCRGTGAGGHRLSGGVRPDGRVFLQGRAGGGDLPLPLGRGLPHRRDRRSIRANRTPGPRGGSRPNRATGRRGGPRGGSFIAQADSG